MKKIRSKLNNSQGVSMIIAMVFMLICMFVGAVVLTSSTVNAGRMKHTPKEKEFLNQRSAALLVAEELRTHSDTSIRMLIHEGTKKTQPVQIDKNGTYKVTGQATISSANVQFEVCMPEGITMTALQRIVLESTVLNYLNENSISITDSSQVISFINFKYGDQEIHGINEFWLKPEAGAAPVPSGTIDVASPVPEIDSFTVNYKSDTNDQNLYDFVADFGTYSQLSVRMVASKGSNAEDKKNDIGASVEEIDTVNKQKVTTNTKLTVISWSEPMIVKGGSV